MTRQVPNTSARQYVLKCEEFKGSRNTYATGGHSVIGRRVKHFYVVYSYGYWPMFVCDTRTDTWFANSDKYSRTTSKHQGQCWPHGKNCAPLPTNELERLLNAARGNL